MESIKGHDHYLDPPTIPEYALCIRCGDKYHADDLNDDGLCDSCQQFKEACEQELE